MNVDIIALIFQVVTAPGYEDTKTKFTLHSGSCVSDDLSPHEAMRIDIKMLTRSPRKPVPFSSSSNPPPRNRVFYPDQVNPFQEEPPKRPPAKTKHTITGVIHSISRTNSKLPSNRPGVFDSSRSTLGIFARNTTPHPPRRRRRRRRRPENKGNHLGVRTAFINEQDSIVHFAHRDDIGDDYEYYDSEVDGIKRC